MSQVAIQGWLASLMEPPWRPDPRYRPAPVIILAFQYVAHFHPELAQSIWTSSTAHPLPPPATGGLPTALKGLATLQKHRANTPSMRVKYGLSPIEGLEIWVADLCGRREPARRLFDEMGCAAYFDGILVREHGAEYLLAEAGG